MPTEYSVDREKNLLRIRRWGDISTQDEMDALDQRSKDPLINPGIRVLIDCREVEAADSVEVVKYLAHSVPQIAGKLQCGTVAIVVSTDVQFGMARMYASLTDLGHPDTHIFRDIGDAEAYLAESRDS